MCNQKLYNGLFRGRCGVLFSTVSVLILLLSLTAVQASAGGSDEKIDGIVKEMPGLGWPYGIWYLEDKRVQVTEETVFKGDQSKATFGTKVVAKGCKVDGVFVVSEIEVNTDDNPSFANR